MAVLRRVVTGWREVSQGGAEDGGLGMDGSLDFLMKSLVLAEHEDGVLAHFGGGEKFSAGFLAGEVESELKGGWGRFVVLRAWCLVGEIDADVEIAQE